MRSKTIINGFKNSQKFRFILTANSGEDVGMIITIQQMSENFVTRDARVAVWSALERLSAHRSTASHRGEPLPNGLVTDAHGFRQIQIDLN